ncbi:MAG: hypothetical protein ACR2RV_19800, partial [Verrucomicrobiales bacterium]
MPLQLSSRFNDFDALAEASRGWNLDFWQLDSGPFRAEFDQMVTPSATLIETAFSRKIEQRGAPPSGCRTFGFAATDNFDAYWRGKNVGPHDLMLFPPGGELESLSKPGFHVFAFSVSEQLIEAAAARRGLDSVEILFPETDLVSCPAPVMAGIRNRARLLSRSAADHPGLVNNRPFRDNLESDLVDRVLDAVSISVKPAGSRPVARSR